MEDYRSGEQKKRGEQLEMLAQALQQQRRGVRCFELLASIAPEPGDRRLLSAMQREERRHYYLLEGIYEEIAGCAFEPPRLSVALPRSYIAMLQVMIRTKLDTVDFYTRLDESLHCVKQRELLSIIISDQKEQTRILATIYDRNFPGGFRSGFRPGFQAGPR